ncbi:MAG: hypothetical protein M1828_003742 [Chrysothrix sp. TS-e1954]|nr:MAG: hypothetical protein M1828_003742 [Chrysothrix sp. TS-e1954]
MSSSPTLPPFKVRQLLASEANDQTSSSLSPIPSRGSDGLIRISRHAYDELLRRQPEASLNYLDEDDGDVILVGSSFELGQRLLEPVSNHHTEAELPRQEATEQSLHVFDVARTAAVVEAWRQIQHVHDSKPRETNDSLTPEGKKQASAAGIAILNSTRRGITMNGTLDALDNEQSPRGASHGTASTTALTEPSTKDPLLLKSGNSPVRPAQQDHGIETAARIDTTSQPLMEMFEAELAELVRSTKQTSKGHETSSNSARPTHIDENISPPELVPTQQSIQKEQNTDGQNSSAQSPRQTEPAQRRLAPGEVLGRSLKTAFDSLGVVASTILEHNPDIKREVHRHVRNAQKDVSGHVEKAMRASALAVDSLRGVKHATSPASQPQAQHEWAHAGSTHTELAHADAASVASDHAGHQEVTEAFRNTIDPAVNTRTPSREPTSIITSQSSDKSTQPKATMKAHKIVGRRFIQYGDLNGISFKQYLIRWLGHGPAHDMWYDEDNLGGCSRLVAQYEHDFPEGNESKTRRVSPRSANATCDITETALLHQRTAGDRMITSKAPKYDTASQSYGAQDVIHVPSSNETNEGNKQSHDLRVKELPSPSNPYSVSVGSAGANGRHSGPADDSSYTNLNNFGQLSGTAETSELIQPTKLNHRRSWHPGSSKTTELADNPFECSTADVMRKYPSIAQIEQRSPPMGSLRESYRAAEESKSKRVRSKEREAASAARTSNYKPPSIEEEQQESRHSIENYYKTPKGFSALRASKSSAPEPTSSNEPWLEPALRSAEVRQPTDQKVRFAPTPTPASTEQPPVLPPPKDRSVRRTRSLAFNDEPMTGSSSWWKPTGEHSKSPDSWNEASWSHAHARSDASFKRAATTASSSKRSEDVDDPQQRLRDSVLTRPRKTNSRETRWTWGARPQVSDPAGFWDYAATSGMPPSLPSNPFGAASFSAGPASASAWADAYSRGYGSSRPTAPVANTSSSHVPSNIPGAWPAARNASPHESKLSDCTQQLVMLGYTKSTAKVMAASAGGELQTALDLLEEDQKARARVDRGKY